MPGRHRLRAAVDVGGYELDLADRPGHAVEQGVQAAAQGGHESGLALQGQAGDEVALERAVDHGDELIGLLDVHELMARIRGRHTRRGLIECSLGVRLGRCRGLGFVFRVEPGLHVAQEQIARLFGLRPQRSAHHGGER